jgi:pimeloyl-ACP methyl ester carboxylesterase
VKTSKGIIEYTEIGSGPPLLYFHGTGAGNDAAVLMERWLIDDGFRLIVPNRPGYYGTPLSCGRLPEDCADLAARLLDHLQIDHVAVIGTSGGGLAAPTFAARHPMRTRCLVLQCALSHRFDSAHWMPPSVRQYFPLFYFHRIFQRVLRIGYQLEMRKVMRTPNYFLNYLCGERSQELCNDPSVKSLIPLLVDMEIRCARQTAGIVNDWANDVGKQWLTPDIVHCPTLILHDRMDPLVTIAQVEWARKCIPHAEYCDLHAGGHLIWVGQDSQRMRQVRGDFLRRHQISTSQLRC